MITVVIPALNESQTIADVVAIARRDPAVTQVVVVDDGSLDDTAELARQAGAEVITSTLLGKGASMEDGLRAARNELLVYLDGDLRGLRPDLVSALAAPVARDEADFVKARFSRAAGRVTTLTARPLLRVFFPELARIEQPLGGIIAAKRSVLSTLRFENDYGVDVGLLIDAAAAGARIVEVDIGHIEHDSQPLELLGDMAAQVVRALVDRAARQKRLRLSHVQEVSEVERHTQAELEIVLQRVGPLERLALFDLDGTLLRGQYFQLLAAAVGKTDELETRLAELGAAGGDRRAESVAPLLANVPQSVFEQVAREAPLTPGAPEAVVGLRKAGFRVGIVSDSLRVVSEIVRRRVFADFSVAHLMRFRQGKATGKVVLSPAMRHAEGCPLHEYCKANVLPHLRARAGEPPRQVLVVGHGDNDVCLLRAADIAIAFQPRSAAVRAVARHVLMDDLHSIPDRAA